MAVRSVPRRAWTWGRHWCVVQTGTKRYSGTKAYWGSALAPWTGRCVYACLYAYTFVYVAYQLGTYPRQQSPQPLTGLGFCGVCCCLWGSGWGWPGCNGQALGTHFANWYNQYTENAPICTAFYTLVCTDLYRLVPLKGLHILVYISVVQTGTEWYNPTVMRWYSGTTPYGCTVVPLTSSRTWTNASLENHLILRAYTPRQVGVGLASSNSQNPALKCNCPWPVRR